MSWVNSFNGKSVIVTGGGRGIGRSLCVELHKLGATVYAVSNSPDDLKSLQAECPTIRPACVDLSDWNATRDAIEKIEAVDMLVNNAGVYNYGSLFEVTEQDFDSICSVNLKAVINVTQIVAKKMIDASKAGAIVNISSVAGLKAFTKHCAYSTLKAGLDHLTKIMALELGPCGIRVNSVNPGPVLTNMLLNITKAQEANGDNETVAQKYNARVASPKKIVDMDGVVNSILFLLSDSSPMVNGTHLALDGGYVIS